jgi:hypothetical protein
MQRDIRVIAFAPAEEPSAPTAGHILNVPKLAEYASPEFYRVLASPYREAYWALLVRIYRRKFLTAGNALTRPDAIDLAQLVLENAAELGVDPEGIAWEEGWTLPELEDDTPNGSGLREGARRLLRVLVHAGWIHFQTYADQRYPVLEFTLIGQRQVSHMLRDIQGDRLPLRSFADRLHDLVGNRNSRMHAAPGRLPQLKEVVGNLNERIHELLSGIKSQSEGVIRRTRTVRAVLKDLLEDFEKHVGHDYALLKRNDSPPRLWSAVVQAVYDLQEDAHWIEREARWYLQQHSLPDGDAARTAVLGDLRWIAEVTTGIRAANEMLDQRYARYVTQAQRRVEAMLRQSHNTADGLRTLLEVVAAGRMEIEPVQMPKVTGIGPVGFNWERASAANAAPEPVPVVDDMSEAEARALRRHMDDSIPVAEVRRWLGAHEDEPITLISDVLPLSGMDDYLYLMFAVRYALEGKSGIRFEPFRCAPAGGGCVQPEICTTCFRHEGAYIVPRGTFFIDPQPTPTRHA